MGPLMIPETSCSEMPPSDLTPGSFDTVICFNVLEPIRHNQAALERIRTLLRPGGRLLLLVPAFPFLCNNFDRGLEHFRRYSKAGLQKLLIQTGFAVEKPRYFSGLGAIGWFVNANVLRKKLLPSGQMKVFDRLVPLLKLERLVGPPFGISVIAVAQVPPHAPA